MLPVQNFYSLHDCLSKPAVIKWPWCQRTWLEPTPLSFQAGRDNHAIQPDRKAYKPKRRDVQQFCSHPLSPRLRQQPASVVLRTPSTCPRSPPSTTATPSSSSSWRPPPPPPGPASTLDSQTGGCRRLRISSRMGSAIPSFLPRPPSSSPPPPPRFPSLPGRLT